MREHKITPSDFSGRIYRHADPLEAGGTHETSGSSGICFGCQMRKGATPFESNSGSGGGIRSEALSLNCDLRLIARLDIRWHKSLASSEGPRLMRPSYSRGANNRLVFASVILASISLTRRRRISGTNRFVKS